MSELLLGALLLLPALAFVPQAQHVFWVPESLAAQLFAPLAALAALKLAPGSSTQPLPRALRLTFLAFGACLLVSAAFAGRRDLALWQLLEWSAYPLAFTAAWLHGGEARGRKRAVYFLLLAGGLNALYSLLQVLQLDRFAWAANFSGRAGGFLGNPNFLGGHLALLSPVALALALNTRRPGAGRALAWVINGLLLLGLLLSQTRGAWIGAGLGLGLLLATAHRRLPGLLSRNKAPLLATAALVLALGGAYLAWHPQLGTRLLETLQGKDEQLSHRSFLMRKAAQLAARHPLLGVGPGNFRLRYPEVQVQGIPKEALASQVYVQSEHAHNDLLQMAADAGWPAALLWLALLALCFNYSWRGLPTRGSDADRQDQTRDPLLLLGLLSGLLALQIHGLANFPFLLVPTQLSAWAMAALALRLALPKIHPEPEVTLSASPEGRSKAKIAVAALALLIIFLNAWRGGRGLASDMLWWVGQGELGLKRADQAFTPLFRALDAAALPGLGRRDERLWLLHGRTEVERGYLWNAVGSFKACLELDPLNPEGAVRLGRTYLELKQAADAEKALFPVAQMAPNFIDVWEPLAASYFMQQKWADAVAAYDWQIYFNLNAASAAANKAAAQGNLGQLPQALLTLRTAQERFPGDAKLQLNLAITYLKLGMKREAREALAAAAKLDPNDPQLDQVKGALR